MTSLSTSLFAFLTLTFVTLSAALCAAVCLKRVLGFSSLARRLREALLELESYQSRISTLETRVRSQEKRTYLEERRDPETGKAAAKAPQTARAAPAGETKQQLRQRLGLIGPNAARIANAIHNQGGLR